MKINSADFANLSLLDLPAPLQRKLQRATLVPSGQVPPDVVTMQSRVVVLDEATGLRHVLAVVYPAEADAAAGRVSVLDPIGVALFGAVVGDMVDADNRRLRIEQISYQPEHSMRANLVVRD
jgi:regulator of nucleoside diphosphate kinase